MDWAKFFQDNSQSLFTLAGVFLGSIITFTIGYLNLRSQSKEREKDRQEQRREAALQAKQKWIERDVLTVMDLVEKIIKMKRTRQILQVKMGNLHEQMDSVIGLGEQDQELHVDSETVAVLLRESKAQSGELDNTYSEALQSLDRISTLVTSLADVAILEKHKKFLLAFLTHQLDKAQEESWGDVVTKSGELHKVLRDKLISIRDS